MSRVALSERGAARSPTRRHFTPWRVTVCLLPMLAFMLWLLAFANLASAGGVATAEAPARLSVPIPASAKGATVVMLEIGIAVSRKPASGQLGALVRFKRPGGVMTELGRVSIVGDGQSYQFNIGALAGNGAAEIEVGVIDRGGGAPPSGAELSIRRAEIVAR